MSDKKETLKRKVTELLQNFIDSETNRESEESLGLVIDYLEDKRSEYDTLADVDEAEPDEIPEDDEIDLDDDSDEFEEDDELDEKFEL